MSTQKKKPHPSELLWRWFFESNDPEPPPELVDNPQLTHVTIISCFPMNQQLNAHLVNRLSGFNLYSISKRDLLKRLKELIRRFKVSPYDYWTLAQKKPHQDPLAKCLWRHYEIKPQDLSYVIEVSGGRQVVESLCGKAVKLKKNQDENDVFSQLANLIQQQSKPNNANSQLQQTLEDYKQWIIDLLSTKTTVCNYEGCRNCPLRNQPFVPPDFIINDPSRNEVDIMIVGMNPYVDEVKQGKPFVGRSGKKLREVLSKIFDKHNIVITNTCMCFVPDNKDPDKQSQACCKPLLLEQIKRIKPKIVVPLGGLAASNLLNQPVSITKIAGQKFEIET